MEETMKKSAINPILVLIIVLLIAVVFFSPHISPQSAENKTLEEKVVSLESEKQNLEQRVTNLEKSVAELWTALSKKQDAPPPCRGRNC